MSFEVDAVVGVRGEFSGRSDTRGCVAYCFGDRGCGFLVASKKTDDFLLEPRRVGPEVFERDGLVVRLGNLEVLEVLVHVGVQVYVSVFDAAHHSRSCDSLRD